MFYPVITAFVVELIIPRLTKFQVVVRRKAGKLSRNL